MPVGSWLGESSVQVRHRARFGRLFQTMHAVEGPVDRFAQEVRRWQVICVRDRNLLVLLGHDGRAEVADSGRL